MIQLKFDMVQYYAFDQQGGFLPICFSQTALKWWDNLELSLVDLKD